MILRPLFFLALLCCNKAYSQEGFKISINTNETGSSCAKCFTIPTNGGGYNYSVDWESDGIVDQTGITGSVTKTYENAGIYNITILGIFPQIYFNNSGDTDKLISIERWGSNKWRSMSQAFRGCDKMVYNATDKPDLSIVTDLSYMFAGCSKFNGSINDWSTDQITNMTGMFNNASSFNNPLDRWKLNPSVTLEDFLSNCGMDCGNYSRTLIGWSLKTPTISNKTIGVIGLQYGTSAVSQRIFLVSKGWVFSGDSASNSVCDKSSFIFTWKTDGEGEGSCMTCLNVYSNGLSDNFDIDWNNDGVFDEKNVSNTFIKDYGTPGTYTIRIIGKMEKPPFLFSGANGKLISVDQWGVISWKNLKESFTNCTQLTINAIDAPVLDECTSMSLTFANCPNFNSDISHWDVSNIKSMDGLFSGCKKYNKPLQKWNTTKVENLFQTFLGAETFNQPLNNWNVSRVQSMKDVFRNAKSFNQPLGSWNVLQVLDMSNMFNGALAYNQILGAWDFNPTVNLNGLLTNSGISCSNYSATLQAWSVNPNIPTGRSFAATDVLYPLDAVNARNTLKTSKSWTITGDVALKGSCIIVAKPLILEFKTDNQGASCNSCINLDLNSLTNRIEIDWNSDGIYDEISSEKSIIHDYGTPGIYSVSIKAEKLRLSFVGPDKQKLISIKQWGDINYLSLQDAFSGCLNLEYKAIDKPNLYNITSLSNIFSGCKTFNGNIGSWDVSRVTNMNSMFSGAISFNQSLGGWNVSKVTSMISMFDGAATFNQSLGTWTFAANVNLTNFLKNAGLSCLNYASSLKGWAINTATPANLNITVTGLKYPSSSVSNRNFLINKGWKFTGDIQLSGECEVKPLVFKIKTDNPGESCSTCLTLENSTTIPVDIDWNGDGIYDEFNKTGNITHNYGAAGVYTIKIAKRAKSLFRYFRNDSKKLVSFDQWGDATYTSITNGFANCENMQYSAIDNPDLTEIKSLYGLFSNCKLFNSDISGWDVSNIEDLSLVFENATSFNQPLSSWNTAKVKNMLFAFKGATSFNQNINNWDVSSCTALVGTFMNAKSFNQPLSNWNTSNVEVMGDLFNGAESFNQHINSWNIGSCSSLTRTFESALSFNQSLSNWDVSKIKTFYFTFKNAQNFDQSLANWKFSNEASIINGVFEGCGISCNNFSLSLEEWANNSSTQKNIIFDADELSYSNEAQIYREKLTSEFGWSISFGKRQGSDCNPLRPMIITYKTDNSGGSCASCIALSTEGSSEIVDIDWDDDGVIDQNNATGEIVHDFGSPGLYTIRIFSEYHFISFGNKDSTKLISLDQWGDSRINGSYLFNNCTNLKYKAIDTPLFLGVGIDQMFYGCKNFNGDLSGWDLSKIVSMKSVFNQATKFNGNLSSWDVSNVESMSSIFAGATSFNQNINSWNVSKVKDLSQAFINASSFNQRLDNWDVSNVQNMTSIFYGASSFNQNINNWNVSNVKNLSQAFTSATSYNQPLGLWDVSNVENMDNLFAGASSFDQNINSWNVNKVKSLQSAFTNASIFNQPLDKWNVANVSNLSYAFVGATNFNQPLSNWNFAPQANLENFLSLSGISCENYTRTLIGWAENPLQPDNLTVGCVGMIYELAATPSRDKLINQNGWSILGDIEGSCDPLRPMIVTFKTNINANGSCSSCVTLGNVFNQDKLEIDWNNDGIYDETITNGEVVHDFGVPGTYTIPISGSFFQRVFYNQDSIKLVSFDQWGDSGIYGSNFFYGCTNMNYNAVDNPKLIGESIDNMFNGCKIFNGNISDWNVSNVENMKNMFFGATNFNQNINSWNTSKVKNLYSAFTFAYSFNQPLNNWDVSNVEDFGQLFFNSSSFNQNINNWDVSKGKNFYASFYDATSFDQPLSDWTFSPQVYMENFLDYSGMSCENYSITLMGWANNSTGPDSISIGVENMIYNFSAGSARDQLINKAWTLIGDRSTNGSCDQTSSIIWQSESGICTKDIDGKYKINLEWQVSEYKNIDFYIELISENQDVYPLGFIDADPVSTTSKIFNYVYEVPDSLISNETNFRIRAQGTDLAEYFANIKVDPCDPVGTNDDISITEIVYPNPILRYSLLNLKAGHDQINIFNINGELIKTIDKSINSWEINLLSGTYVIKEYFSNRIYKLIVID